MTAVDHNQHRFRWFRHLMKVLNGLAILLLCLSYIAPYISPAIFWPLAFLGLLHPAWVLTNILFLLYWIVRRKRTAFYSLAALFLGWSLNSREMQLRPNDSFPVSLNSFHLMSWNTKLFDLYNWSENRQTRKRMLDLINKEQPDILCLQEFYTQDTGYFRNLDSIKRILLLPYCHTEYTYTKKRISHWGVATFSRYPILNQGKIVFNNRSNNICIYTDLLIQQDTVRIYNMHLQSVHFGYSDYTFMDKVASGDDAENEIENSKNILRRLKKGYTARAGQADAIAEHIANCPYPVIVCGDFNDTPVSYAYTKLAHNLNDAFIESGHGFGKTFVNFTPFPRIDYILHSPDLHTSHFTVTQTENMSDHYPIGCRIVVK
jgi:endonuclease/exonuclease/phosphatase family metal-dependent hydrolase